MPQWILFGLAILVALGGAWFYKTEQNDRRAIRREELAVENKKADTAAQLAAAAVQRADNARYRLATERAKIELDYSRAGGGKSTTLDEEHRRVYAVRDAALETAGITKI